jgi:hypothetical protein
VVVLGGALKIWFIASTTSTTCALLQRSRSSTKTARPSFGPGASRLTSLRISLSACAVKPSCASTSGRLAYLSIARRNGLRIIAP